MPNNNDDSTVSPTEYKKITEAMYKQNLELARLYKQVESLNQELEVANENLKNLIKQRESLVHLVTHKVKGSFTRSKYIFASILDGTFGEVSEQIKKIATTGLESDNMGIETVDLVLNADNLQKGTVKYEMKPIDCKDIFNKTIEDKKGQAEAKGLTFTAIMGEGSFDTVGDFLWLQEAFNNLVENAIKYTKTGTITALLKKKDNKILFSVKDTGIGITEEDKRNLFTEGGRGRDAVKVNVDSTGYGLYSVKLIVAAHKGRVWADSEGVGKGSAFTIELAAI